MVYQVKAFPFWGDLLELVAKRYEYLGPMYVMKTWQPMRKYFLESQIDFLERILLYVTEKFNYM